MSFTKRYTIICNECGRFCGCGSTKYIPYGYKDYESLESLDPMHICKKCIPKVKEKWIKKFKDGCRHGDWQKSEAEIEAAKMCGLSYIYSNGVGTLGTKDWVGAHQYIQTEEYERLSKLPYWGYCKVCGAVRKGGYCSDKKCKESFYAKYGHEPT